MSTPHSSQSDFGSKLPVYLYPRVMFYVINKAYFQPRRQKTNEGRGNERWPTLSRDSSLCFERRGEVRIFCREVSMFLKTEDKYSQGAGVIRNVIATFVLKGVAKQAKETDNSLK